MKHRHSTRCAGTDGQRQNRKTRMRPWHDIYIDEELLVEALPVIVEVPMGCKNKYEIDKRSGLLKLDRVLHSSVHYPANYGFVPRSFCDDGDPLDALVLTQEPIQPLTLVVARPIGVVRMRDDKGSHDKIIAVAAGDPSFEEVSRHTDLPAHRLREIERFFLDYKILENKEVVVDDIMDKAEALTVLREALAMYRQLRRNEVR